MIPFELYTSAATASKLLVQCTYNENKESLKTNKKLCATNEDMTNLKTNIMHSHNSSHYCEKWHKPYLQSITFSTGSISKHHTGVWNIKQPSLLVR